jgi:hypothetical protein
LAEDERRRLWNDIKEDIVKLVENRAKYSAARKRMVSSGFPSPP